jgi:hypothetical protein
LITVELKIVIKKQVYNAPQSGTDESALFEKDLEGMPLEIADGLRRLREAEEKAALN